MVENTPFDRSVPEVSFREANGSIASRPLVSFVAPYFVPGVGLLAFYVFLFRPVLKLLERWAKPSHEMSGRTSGVPEGATGRNARGLAGEEGAGNEEELLSRARKMSADEPEAVGRLLRGWLSEEGP